MRRFCDQRAFSGRLCAAEGSGPRDQRRVCLQPRCISFSSCRWAVLVGLPDEFSGLWAGLAVNDLSSSVAVGSQFSDDAGLIATATKSLRILLLRPDVADVQLASPLWPQRPRKATEFRKSPNTYHFFIVGYLLFFGVRLAGDAAFGGTGAWGTVLSINDQVVTFLIVCVCAGIGLRINLTTIVEIGWKAVAAGACGSIGMAGVSLVMLLFFARNSPWLVLTSGVTALVISYGLYRLGEAHPPGNDTAKASPGLESTAVVKRSG